MINNYEWEKRGFKAAIHLLSAAFEYTDLEAI